MVFSLISEPSGDLCRIVRVAGDIWLLYIAVISKRTFGSSNAGRKIHIRKSVHTVRTTKICSSHVDRTESVKG